MLRTKHSEQSKHGLLRGSVIPFRSFYVQVQESLQSAFKIFATSELACFVINDGFFALNVFLGGFGVEVQQFQQRFRFAVLVVGFGELGEYRFCLFGENGND